MGTSVDMLMSNYVQVPSDDDTEKEYQGLGDLSEEVKEVENIKKNKKREYQTSGAYKATRNARNSNKKQ